MWTLIASVALGSTEPDPFGGWTTTLTASGARIWSKVLPDDPRVRVGAFLSVGHAADPPGLEGLAHLTEHVRLFASWPGHTESELRALLLERDGHTNGTTDTDSTNYFVDLPRQEVAFGVDYLVDRVAVEQPLTEEGLAWERRAVVLEKDLSPPGAAPWMLLGWPTEPSVFERDLGLARVARYRVQTWGSLHAITAGDVRRFWDEWYGPGNLTFVVIGGFDEREVVDHLRRRLDELPAHGVEASALLPARPSGRVDVSYETLDQANARVEVRWRVPDLTERDHAMALLLRNALKHRVHDELRVRRKTAYGVKAVSHVRWGHALIGVDAEVRADALDESRKVVLDAFDDLLAGRLSDEAWIRLRQDALAPFRRGNLTREDLFEWVETVHPREVFPRFPPLLEIAGDVDQFELAEWMAERVVPHGRTELVVRALPGATAWFLALAWGAAALVLLAVRRLGPSPVELVRLRYVRRLKVMPASAVGLLVLALVAMSATPWLVRLEMALQELGSRWDSVVAHALAFDAITWVVGVPLFAALLWIPRKVLLFEHELRLKRWGPWSSGWRWEEVTEVTRCRALDVVRRGRAPGCTFCAPALLRPGVYVGLGPRRGLFFHTRDDAELVERVLALRAAAPSS